LNIPAWTTAKRLLVKQNAFQEVSDLGEIDTADPASLADFIRWGVKTYPAAHYMLVLWDHGGGWQGFGVDETLPSSANSDMMGLLKIQAGVSNGLQQAGLSKFDIIGFDACLMASLEVAETLKPYSNYLLASEETEPGHGWDYTALTGAASLDAVALSKKILDGYQAIANTPQWDDGASITLSLIDLTKLASIETALSRLSADYGTPLAVAPISSAVGKDRSSVLEFGKNPDPTHAMNLVDAGSLFAALSAAGADASALQTAIQAAVVYKVNGSGYAAASGMSVYFPGSAAYYSSAIYDALPGMATWRMFLQAYYGAAATAIAPSFIHANYSATSSVVTFSSTLTAGSLANVATATVDFGLPGTSGDAWVFGEKPAQTSTDGTGDHVSGTWDYTFLHLMQTTPTAHDEYGYYLVRLANASTGVIVIPMSYYAPGSSSAQDSFRLIVVDLNTSTMLSDTYYLITNGVVGELTPDAGATMHAQVAYLADAKVWSITWVDYTSSGGFDASSPIDFELFTLPQGASFFAGLRVENAGGQGAWISTSVASPPTKP
jgi:hypothetical protein